MKSLERRVRQLEEQRTGAFTFPPIDEMSEAQLREVLVRVDDMSEQELLQLLGGEPDAEELAHALHRTLERGG